MASIALDKQVLHLPESYGDLDDTDIQRLRQQWDRMLADKGKVLVLPHGMRLEPLAHPESILARACWLAKCSDAERAFVVALAAKPTDDVTLLVFADWLADQRRDEEAARMRSLVEGAV